VLSLKKATGKTDIGFPESYFPYLKPSPKHKKDSSDFSFSYDCKIYFMVSKIYFTHHKIYFYIHVPRFGSSIGFLCRNFN